MALISAQDFLSGKGSSSNGPAPKGLISAQDFLANRKNMPTDEEMSQVYNPGHENDAVPQPASSITGQQYKQYADQMKSAYQSNPDSFTNPQSFADQVQKPNFLDKIFKDNPVARLLNYPFAKAAQDSIPDANYLGTDVNARQDFAQRNPIPSTGSPTLDKVGDFAGGIGSMFTPIGTGGALINDVGKISSGLLGTKAGRWLDSAAGKISANTANLANPVLNQAGINLSTDLAQKAGQGLLRGGTLGAAFGAVQPLATGSGQLSDVPQSVLENAAMFAGGDALLPFAGAGGKLILDKFKPDAPLPDYSNISLSQGNGIGVEQPRNIANNQPVIAEPKTFPPINKVVDDNSIKPLSSYADTLYRESSPQNALDLIPGINSSSEMKGDQVYFSNNKDLALGQGTNKGVMIEFSPRDIQGHVNTNKPTWQHSYNNGDAEFVGRFNNQGTYKDAVKSVTIQPDAKIDKVTQMQLNRALSSWEQVKNPDGSVSYLRPQEKVLNIDAKQPEPIKLTPAEIARNERIDKFSKTEDNPIIPDTAGQIQSKTIAEKTPFAQKANNAYIKGVDNVHRLNEFDKKVAEVTGDLPASEQSHTLALNSRGSDMISRQILEKNMVDSQGNVTGGSFKSVVSQIPKGKQSEFEDYLVAQHSITRMGRGEKVYKDDLGMTVQKAQAKVAELEKANPDFKKAAESYYQYNQQLGKSWLVDTGLITPEQWQGYLDANPHYVPNQRIFSDLEKSQQYGSKGGFANQTAPIKKAEGSQRPIVRPIESTIENTAKYVKTAKQNEVMQTLYHNIQKDPESFKDWAEIVHDQPKSDVTELLHKDGPDGLLDEVSKSFDNATRKSDLTKGNIVSAFVNGERVHIKVNDPQLLESLTNLGPQGQHFVMNTIGKITKTMKVLTTGANPVFSLTRNIFRDIPTAFISSKSTNNPVKFAYDMVHSVLSVMGNGELYNSFKNIGGGHSSSIAADRNLLAQSMEKILPSKGIGQTLKRTLITKPYHALENLNNALETAPRLAEFKRFSKDGSYDSKVSGLYEANDVTTNFNRFGNYTKQADALFPYLNAAVQGLDKTVRVFKDNPTAAFSKASGVVAVPTILMYVLNHNNPDYQQLSNFIKDNNFLIPKSGGTFIKIPKSREFGTLFSTPIERVLRQWNDHDPNAFQDFVHNFIQNIAPPGIGGAIQGAEQGGLTGALTGIGQDTIAGPIASLSSNKDFANRPIVPQDLLKLSSKNQFDSKTSEPAKFLGNLFNTSPKQLDFLTKSYGGVLGQLGLPLTTQGGSIGETLKRQVTADPTFSNDISRNFYDAKNKADTAKADSKVTGDPLTKDLSTYYDRISNNLSSLRKLEKSVQKDSSLSKDEKNQKLKDLTQQMNSILKQSIIK